MSGRTELELGNEIRDWLGGFPSSAPAIAVPVFNAYEDVLECVESLLATIPPGTPVLVLDDASTDERIPRTLEPLAQSRGFAYARKPANSGFVGTVNLAFEWCAPRDVIIVNSDVVVPPRWLERLQAAAYFRSTIATATPLTNYGTILSVPHRNEQVGHLVENMTLSQADDRIRQSSLALRPIIPAAVGHCCYFKRAALDAVGCFDEVFAPGYGEEVDFSQRAVIAGFSHVAADDLFVYHKGSRSFDDRDGQEKRRALMESHDQIIHSRYPWYRQWVRQARSDVSSPLALALERARAALLGYCVAVDATHVDGLLTDETHALTLDLVRALATAPARRSHLAMIINDHVSREALHDVDGLVDEVVRASDLKERRFDLIHRPFPIGAEEELFFLQKVASRLVVSQSDLDALSNPSCAASFTEWARYQRLTQLTFARADGIIFASDDVAQDAAHRGLHSPDDRTCVTYGEAGRWGDVAERTWDFYQRILDMPPRPRGWARSWRLAESAPEEPKTWRERTVFAWRVLRQRGLGSLWVEIRQYLKWRFS